MTNTNELIRPRWGDRVFHFVHPLWMIQEFAERLSGTPARIAELIQDLPQEVANHQFEGAWSIQQNIGHLSDVEELWQQRLVDLKAGRKDFTPADGAYFGERAKRHQDLTISQVLEDLRANRGEFVSQLRDASPELQMASCFHERLGCSMRLVDCAQFAAEHDDDHLLRIRFLLGQQFAQA